MENSLSRPLALVVDDDYSFAEYLCIVLESAGWRALVCMDPLKACDIVTRERPDLILLDLVMPNMSGLEVLLWVKEQPQTKDIPVVLCSVNMDRKTALEVAALGGVQSLTKPLTKQEIIACLNLVHPAKQPA